MDIMNLQNPMVEKSQNVAFAKKNSTSERQSQKKGDNFSSTFDRAVERSVNKNSRAESAKVSGDAEKPTVPNNENQTINQPRSPISTENSKEDVPTSLGAEQAELDVKAEISEEFINVGIPLIAQMPPAPAIIEGNFKVQPNDLPFNFSQHPMMPQGMADIKNNLLLEPKIVEQMLANANIQNKGQTVLQGTANEILSTEILSTAKQDAGILTTQGELSKLTKAEVDTLLQQSNNSAKQAQAGVQNPTQISESAKVGSEQLQSVVEMVKLNPEQPKVNMQQLNANAEQSKIITEQLKDNTQQLKVNGEQPKLNTELIKTNSQLPNQSADTVKPAVEIAKLTVVDTPKPLQGTLVKPNEQPVAAEINNSPQTAKENTEQNFGSRQNNAGQQSFSQTMESALGQMKNNVEQTPNNAPVFAVSQDTATSNLSEKPTITQPQQQPTQDFLNPRDDFQIKNQIIQHATLINRSAQESEMIIRLKPEHLGELALKVTVNNGVITASFHTNNAEVRGILENSLQQLKNDLANAGFKVDNVSISSGLSQFNSEQERALNWQQERLKRISGKNGEAGYQETIEDAVANQQIINSSKDDGVDYRI